MATSSTRARSTAPIAAYVGTNGGGKTLCMIRDTLPALDAGRRVLSTVQLLDPESGLPHEQCEMLTSWRQLVHAEDCVILLDEITGIASSRQSMSMPAQLLNKLQQLRKANCVVRWTSPSFMRADTGIRSVTKTVTVCRGFLSGPPVVEGGWPSKRLFRFVTYAAEDIEAVEAQQLAKAKALCKEWWYRGTDSRAASTYNTLDGVSTLDHVDDHGACLECGGTRSRPKCSCGIPHRATSVGNSRGASHSAAGPSETGDTTSSDLHPN